MNSKKNVVKVTIQGGEYSLRTETAPERAMAVAAYLDEAITDAMHAGNIVEPHRAAILAALRIAGELFDERDESAQLETDMRELSDEIRPWLPPAKRHD